MVSCADKRLQQCFHDRCLATRLETVNSDSRVSEGRARRFRRLLRGVDGADPQETRQVKEQLGFVDGQTTNPSLIAKNPHIKERIASVTNSPTGTKWMNTRKSFNHLPLVGDAGVSIEVFSDEKTTAQEMFRQGQEMFSWIPDAYIRYPCTAEGLRAAQNSVKQGMRINMTLCFSQQQAAAVYAATKGTKEPAYVSPLVGRLDDIGQNGMDVVKNIKRMFLKGDGRSISLTTMSSAFLQMTNGEHTRSLAPFVSSSSKDYNAVQTRRLPVSLAKHQERVRLARTTPTERNASWWKA
jgi:hypothetical protein